MNPTKLPSDWVLRESKDYPGRVYYYNKATNECSWIRPVIYPHLIKKDPNFQWPPLVYVSHILIKHTESKDRSTWKEVPISISKKQAYENILNIKKKLENGTKKFEEMAKLESDDIETHENDGVIGWIQRNQLPYGKSFDDAAFKIGINKMYNDPVETDYGYHLILRLG